jgi:hypothetical protein
MVEGLDWDTAPGDHDDGDNHIHLEVERFGTRLTKLVLTYKVLRNLNINGSEVDITDEAREELERREEVDDQFLRKIID